MFLLSFAYLVLTIVLNIKIFNILYCMSLLRISRSFFFLHKKLRIIWQIYRKYINIWSEIFNAHYTSPYSVINNNNKFNFGD